MRALEDIMWASLPQYLAIGMTSEEFWHGPDDLCRAYREAEKIRRENRYAAEWRQGIYMLRAFNTVMDHAFNKQANSEYPDAPLFASPEVERAREEAREKRKMEIMRERFKARAEKFNQAFARRGETAGGER